MAFRTNTNPNAIEIAARGESTRLREFLDRNYGGGHFPKHLLPTGRPDGETILGRIARLGLVAPVEVPIIVHANRFTGGAMMEHPDVPIDSGRVTVVARKMSDDPMDVYTQKVIMERRRVLGAAGDTYTSDFSWDDMLDAHESSRFPVTFLVARTPSNEGGAVYNVADNGAITDMKRVPHTEEEDLVNVGAYIFDPQRAVLRLLEDLASNPVPERNDPLGHGLIDRGLVGAYVLDEPAFNINTLGTYLRMLRSTATTDGPIQRVA